MSFSNEQTETITNAIDTNDTVGLLQLDADPAVKTMIVTLIHTNVWSADFVSPQQWRTFSIAMNQPTWLHLVAKILKNQRTSKTGKSQ